MKLMKRIRRALGGFTLREGWQGRMPLWVGGGGGGSPALPDPAMSIQTYFSCLRVVSEDIAKLPVRVYREGERGERQWLKGHQVSTLLTRRPNRDMTAQAFRETLTHWAMAWGNGFAKMERSTSGEVVGLWPVHPARVTLHFRVHEGYRYPIMYYLLNGVEVLFSDEIFHLKGFGDGYMGYPVTALAAETLGLASSARKYARTFFDSGGRPSGVITVPTELGPEGRKTLREEWQHMHGGAEKTNRTAVLDMGMKWEQVSIPPEDSQMLETRKFQNREIAGWFRVPIHKVGDIETITYNAMEQMDRQYAEEALVPWARRWDQETERKLLMDGDADAVSVRHDFQGLLRGTNRDRAEYQWKEFNMGSLSVNEVRMSNDLEPIEGGDRYYVAGNMVPLGMTKPEMEMKQKREVDAT